MSEDGFHFERVCGKRPLLSAELDYEALIAKGYYLGPEETVGNIEEEADGIFLCLRDPFLFQDDDTRIHIFFGAKAVIDNEVVRVVGHAVFRDPDQLREIELLPPIVVPDGDQFNQLELPNVLKQNDIYYLIVSTTNLAYIGQSDLEAEKTVRVYRSEHLDRGWQCYGDDGKHIVLPPEAELYGLHILSDPSREAGTLTCRAFRVGEAYLPPSLRLRVGGPYPELMFPDELWKMDSGFIRQYE